MSLQSRMASASLFRSFVFGVEDSLVSTVGLLAGVAVGGVSRNTILVTGAVLVVVEAFSMAVGSFMSEESAEEYVARREVSLRLPLLNALVMFLSYILFGLVPLFPYYFFDPQSAFVISIVLTLIVLFMLGFLSARFLKLGMFRHGFSMFFIGGLAVLVGVIVGRLLG